MFLDPGTFDALAAQCAPTVAASTLRAMTEVESGRNVFAIGVVGGRLERQPKNLAEAISTVGELYRLGRNFSAGMVQINTSNWARLGLDRETVFEPCANLRAAAVVLTECYLRARPRPGNEQGALRNALSCYYSGNFVTGWRHGYVQRVVSAAYRIGPAMAHVAR